MTRHFLLLLSALLGAAPAAQPDYSIQAIRYGTIVNFPVAALVMGAPKDEKTDIAMVVWLIRGGGRNVLFDSGFGRIGVGVELGSNWGRCCDGVFRHSAGYRR